MQKIMYYFWFLATMLLCGGAITSCSDDDESTPPPVDKLEVALVKADAVTASFKITSTNITECAYMVQAAAEAFEPNKDVIFAKGIHVVTDKETTDFEVSNLEPTTAYKLYLVGKTAQDQYYASILSADFTTTNFTETITVTEKRPNGFSVHVKVPADVKERGNAIRFTRGSLPYYNMFKMMMGQADADMLLSNGGDERSTTDAKTYTFDEEHSVIFDEEMGEEMEIDNPIVPGEPSVFIAGEYKWGESMYGWGEGYYESCFDYDGWYESAGGGGMLLNAEDPTDEDKFWGDYYHHREVIVTTQPEPLEAKLTIEQASLTPISARFSFIPDESIYAYSVLILDDPTFNDMVMPFLENNKDYLQWFTTSFMAFNDLGAQSFTGANNIELSNFIFEDAIQPGMKFHLLATALGNEDGTKQNFQHLEFVMPERNMEAPVLEVNPINNPEGAESPYEVWFNIKSVGEVPVKKASYVANYERDMEYMFEHGYDPTSLVMEKGNAFTPEEVMYINTEEGYNVKFDSRANATTYLVAIGYNEEGLESEAILAKKRTISLPAEPAVNSPYLTALLGDWTAQADVKFWDYSNNEWSTPQTVEFKVNINNKIEYPETLPADVYDLYQGMSKEKVDALYADFKKCAADYAQRLKDHNCLVCTGFDPSQSEDTELQTPYDLFVSPTYSGFNNEAIFYDFGPKWILRVNQDGSLSVPVNMNQMDPMSNWRVKYGRRNVYHLVGLNASNYIGYPANDTDTWPAFPVTASDDNKSLTIEGMKANNNMGQPDTFYPNAVEMTYNGAQPAAGCMIVSELKLTKGWNDGVVNRAIKSLDATKYTGKSLVSSVNGKYTPKARPAARTPFVKAPRNVKSTVLTPVTYQQAQKNIKATFDKMYQKLVIRNK